MWAAPGSVRRERREIMAESLYCAFCGKEWANGQGKVSRLKAGEMDDFSSLWSIGPVPSRVWYLTPVRLGR